jgi:hypothetical protein
LIEDTMAVSKHNVSVNKRVVDRVLGHRGKFFEPGDFPGSRVAVLKAFSRLEGEGAVTRVRRGLYWRGTETPLGMAPPPPADVVHKVFGTAGIGPARTSAALALGLTTQVPRIVSFAVPYSVDGIPRVHLVERTRRTGRRSAKLSEAEVALLEVLDSWEDVVELNPDVALKRLASLMGTTLRPEALAKAGVTEPARVRERLRVLFEVSGRADLAAAVPSAAHPETRTAALRGLPLAATGA